MTATTAYAAIRFAPRGELSEKQASWIGDIVAQAIESTHTLANLQVDLVQLAKGEHKQATRDDAIAVVRQVEASEVAKLETLLKSTRSTFGADIEFAKSRRNALGMAVTRNRKSVSSMLAQRFGSATPTAMEVEDGHTYRSPNGGVFHSYKGQNGRMLLKLWDAGNFAYFGAAARLPKGSVLMTREEQAEFGKATGTCSRCMRHLTIDESVARGMGPVCWAKG